MKQSLQRNTLAFHLGVRPGVQFRDITKVKVPELSEAVRTYFSKDFMCPVGNQIKNLPAEAAKGHPERDAVIFYLLNHAVSLVRQKVHSYDDLGAYLPVLEAFHWNLNYRSIRMFYYLLIICTRESRHERTEHSSSWWKGLFSKYGAPVCNFQKSIKGKGSGMAAEAIKNSPPDATLGAYTDFLFQVFDEGDYSSGYGGKAWAAVAKVLRDFVHGKLTAEMMMDTAFTLCHNNGPIFNKGMLFDSYSPHIYKILDVQRSGQIPQLIANAESSWHSDSSVSACFSLCQSVLPGEFSGYVDWFRVEELGAMKSYAPEKQAQVAKHGHPSKLKAKVQAEAIKKEIAAKKEAEEASLWIQIMPGVKVKKEMRV